MVVLQLLLDQFEDPLHELELIKVKGGEQTKHQLDEAVNESVVQRVIVLSLLAILRVLAQLNALLNHNFAESEEDFLIGIDSNFAHLCKVIVHFFLLVGTVFPLR
jgi:hypothetical protein